MKKMLRRIGLHPTLSAFTAITGALAGVLGTIYTAHIRVVFPFEQMHHWPPDLPVISFWVFVVVFGFCFGLGTWAQNKTTLEKLGKLHKLSDETRNVQVELRGGVDRLEYIIRTMPPEDVLDRFEDSYRGVFLEVASAYESGASIVDIQKAIIAVLAGLAHLTSVFDHAHQDTVYCVNMMLYHKRDGIDANTLDELNKGLIFFDRATTTLQSLDGFLELIPEFAMRLNAAKQVEADTDTPHIVLPVPRKRKQESKPAVLPGAPEAFCASTGYAGYEDTLTLKKWCIERSALGEVIADEVGRYFARGGDGQSIRSFVGYLHSVVGKWQQSAGIAGSTCPKPGLEYDA